MHRSPCSRRSGRLCRRHSSLQSKSASQVPLRTHSMLLLTLSSNGCRCKRQLGSISNTCSSSSKALCKRTHKCSCIKRTSLRSTCSSHSRRKLRARQQGVYIPCQTASAYPLVTSLQRRLVAQQLRPGHPQAQTAPVYRRARKAPSSSSHSSSGKCSRSTCQRSSNTCCSTSRRRMRSRSKQQMRMHSSSHPRGSTCNSSTRRHLGCTSAAALPTSCLRRWGCSAAQAARRAQMAAAQAPARSSTMPHVPLPMLLEMRPPTLLRRLWLRQLVLQMLAALVPWHRHRACVHHSPVLRSPAMRAQPLLSRSCLLRMLMPVRSRHKDRCLLRQTQCTISKPACLGPMACSALLAHRLHLQASRRRSQQSPQI